MTVLQSLLNLYTLTDISMAEWFKSSFVVTQNRCVKGSIHAHFLTSIDFAFYQDISVQEQSTSKVRPLMTG